MTGSWLFEPLRKWHDRSRFSCGVEALDTYLRRRAGQEQRRNIAFPHVLTRKDDPRVLAYYTLSATSVALSDLPAPLARRLPYPMAPGALIGRLAVDRSMHGQGLGQLALIDALRRLAANDSLAIMLVLVDAKDAAAARFYARFGFLPLAEGERRLYLPFATIRAL